MSTIKVEKEFRIPGTDIILEKGDKVQVLTNSLKEEVGDLYDYFRKEYPKVASKIQDISKEIDWDITGAMGFCLHLLEDVNVPSAFFRKVTKIFEDEFKQINKE